MKRGKNPCEHGAGDTAGESHLPGPYSLLSPPSGYGSGERDAQRGRHPPQSSITPGLLILGKLVACAK